MTFTATRAKELSPEELNGRLVRGVLVEKEAPEFTEEYEKLVAQAQKGE